MKKNTYEVEIAYTLTVSATDHQEARELALLRRNPDSFDIQSVVEVREPVAHKV